MRKFTLSVGSINLRVGVLGWVQRRKQAEQEHSVLSASWLQMQGDQVPHTPAPTLLLHHDRLHSQTVSQNNSFYKQPLPIIETIQEVLLIMLRFVNLIHYQEKCSFHVLPRDEGRCGIPSPKFMNHLGAKWFQIPTSDYQLRIEGTQHLKMVPWRAGTERISIEEGSFRTVARTDLDTNPDFVS